MIKLIDFLKMLILSKLQYNGMIGIVDYYDGSDDNKIHNYAIAIIDKIPKLNNEIFSVKLLGFNTSTNESFNINVVGFCNATASSFFTTFSNNLKEPNSFIVRHSTIINNKLKILPLIFRLKNFMSATEFMALVKDFDIDLFSYSLTDEDYENLNEW